MTNLYMFNVLKIFENYKFVDVWKCFKNDTFVGDGSADALERT